MKSYIQKKHSNGFTIIEVMIVLAVAGLIMLIVFLAVPALQRNSRNTQMRSDAAGVLAGVNEFITNNNGSLPTAISANTTTGDVTVSGLVGSSAASAKVRGGTTVGWAADSAAAATPANPNITIRLNTTCNGNAVVSSPGRAFAAVFNVEGASGDIPQCIQS